MRKLKIFRRVTLLIFAVFLMCSFITVHAYDVNGYHITRYDTVIDVGENNVLYITENITCDFTGADKHGIIRTIPSIFEDRKVIISDITVNENYSVETSREYVAIRIGDADRTISGLVEYTISYYYDYGDDETSDYDKLYHNIVGTDWDCSIYEVTFEINMPSSFDAGDLNMTYGQRYSELSYTSYTISGNTISGSLSDLAPYEGLTIALELPEGYFTGERTKDSLVFPILPVMIGVSLLAVILCIYTWYKRGKDDEIIASPQFYAIKGQSPAEAGYIIDGVIDNKDITSLIFYWADKGYIEITDKKWDYEFTKMQDPVFENKYEKYMFEQLFSYGTGSVVSIKDLQDRFYKDMPIIKQYIRNMFNGKKELVSKESLRFRKLMLLASFLPFVIFSICCMIAFKDSAIVIPILMVSAAFFTMLYIRYNSAENSWNIFGMARKLWIAVQAALLVTLTSLFMNVALSSIYSYYNTSRFTTAYFIAIFACAVSTAFAIATKKRSEYGQQMMQHYIGFRDFIATAEMDRLKALIDENPKYYYNILPYAIVLGLEKKWSKKFESMVLEPPYWYHGYYGRTFSTVYFASRLNSCMFQTTASMVKAPSTSSGSGFSGGGFSGGGGGGGGGSSW